MAQGRAERKWGLAAALILGAVAALAPGCDRTPRLVSDQPDSTEVSAADSTSIYLRMAQRMWDSGMGQDAARLTAMGLHADLHSRTPANWEPRAIAFLDSLNIGVEARSADCALLVNLFARANPLGESWPYVFWCSGDSLEHQPLEGQGMQLIGFAARDVANSGDDTGLAALYGRHGPAGDQPVLMAWTHRGRSWQLAQTLGADSLGGTGTGRFESADGVITLVTETFRTSRGFQECPACPHVNREQRFRWDGQAFRRVSDSALRTPYASFVRFIQALRSADYVGAMDLVSDRAVLERAVHLGWARSRDAWRAAPGTHDRATEMVFFSGAQDAYRVWFEPLGGDWVISSVDTTSRTVEVP